MREQRPIRPPPLHPSPFSPINMQPASVHILGSPREEYQYSCFDIPIKRGRFVYELVRCRASMCARANVRYALFIRGGSAHRCAPPTLSSYLVSIPLSSFLSLFFFFSFFDFRRLKMFRFEATLDIDTNDLCKRVSFFLY